MFKKIMCIFLSAFLFLPILFGVPVSAADVEVKALTEDEWYSMTVSERDSYLNAAIEKNGGEAPAFSGSGRLGKVLSYKYYYDLFNGNPNAKVSLQMMGLVNFNLKLGDTSYEGGGFGGHRGDIDRCFEDFMLEFPYCGDNDYPAFEFTDGRYITWEPLLLSGYADPNYNIEGVLHKAERYGIRFYLHDKSGAIIDMADRNSGTQISLSCKCILCNGGDEPFTDFRFTEDGYYCYTYYGWGWKEDHVTHNSDYFRLPWANNDTTGTSVDAPVTIPVILYNNEDNTTVNTYRDGDYITYDGNTYSYDNSNHSVNIDGRTYNIYYNYDDIGNGDNGSSYLQDFYNYLTNTYITYNYGTTINFDDSNILNALNSIYQKLHAIYNGIAKVGTYIKSGNATLKDILNAIKNISGDINEINEEEKEKTSLEWLKLINLFKEKIGWASLENSVDNIKTAFFGERVYTETENGSVEVSIIDEKGEPVSSDMPSLYIEFMGNQYNLYGCVAYLGGGIDTIKSFISAFLWIGFLVGLFRSIPAIIGGVASVQTETYAQIDTHTGYVDDSKRRLKH